MSPERRRMLAHGCADVRRRVEEAAAAVDRILAAGGRGTPEYAAAAARHAEFVACLRRWEDALYRG